MRELHGTHQSVYEYDGASRRVRIKELTNNVETKNETFVWCGSRICQKRASNGSTIVRSEPPRVPWRLPKLRGWAMGRKSKYPPEVRERGVRLVFEQESSYDSRWAEVTSIAEKMGCSAEALRNWVKQAEADVGKGPGLTTNERERMKDLER